MSELDVITTEQLAELGEGLFAALDDKERLLAPVTANEIEQARSHPDTVERPFRERLARWVDVKRDDFFATTQQPLPPFDHLRDFWDNFDAGPRDGAYYRAVQLKVLPTRLLDFELGFPFGVPACALTPKSEFIDYFSTLGFDLLTYKTVRDQEWPAFRFPQWGFLKDPGITFTPHDVDGAGEIDHVVTATLNPAGTLVAGPSLANSFGVPSLPPEKWAVDVRSSKDALRPGQVLIVSVMGTPEVLRPAEDERLIEQFANAAEQAVDAGADIVEVNLSCPNIGGELLCRDAELSSRVVKAVRARLNSRGTPLFMKISYLDPERLNALIHKCQPYIQGVVAINSVQAPTHDSHGRPFFNGRKDMSGAPTDRAGVSGSAILELGLETTRQLAAMRTECRAESDWVIIGVGGVTRPEDFKAYRDEGADAVQSCSGAWLNPSLAAGIRNEYGRRTTRDRVMATLENLSSGGAAAFRRHDSVVRRADAV